jgi:flagellar protein FlgJ
MNEIQNSLNRFSITENKLNSIKNQISEDTKKNSFREELEEATENLNGKVASSSIRVSPNIKEEIKADSYRKKLFDASVEFESIFVKMMLTNMRKTVDKSGLINGGYAEEIFEDFLYDEYAKKISQNESLGIAEELYKTLSKSLPKLDIKS